MSSPEHGRRNPEAGNANETLLPRNYNFQLKYSEAIGKHDRRGVSKIHNRPPEPKSIVDISPIVAPVDSIRVPLGGFVTTTRIAEQLAKSMRGGLWVGEVRKPPEDDGQNPGVNRIEADKLAALLNQVPTPNFMKTIEVKPSKVVPTPPPAQVLVVDYRVRGMDPSRIDGFPPAYVVSAAALGPDLTEKAALHVIGDAFSQRGLGNNLTPENPFHMVAIAESYEDKTPLTDKLQKLTQLAGVDRGKRIAATVVTSYSFMTLQPKKPIMY